MARKRLVSQRLVAIPSYACHKGEMVRIVARAQTRYPVHHPCETAYFPQLTQLRSGKPFCRWGRGIENIRQVPPSQSKWGAEHLTLISHISLFALTLPSNASHLVDREVSGKRLPFSPEDRPRLQKIGDYLASFANHA